MEPPTEPGGSSALRRDATDECSDEHIVDLIRTKADDGTRLLLEQHGRTVKGMLMSRFGRGREEDIEQAINDAACSIWRHISRYDVQNGSLGGLLKTSSENNVCSILRAEKARPILRSIRKEELDELESKDDQIDTRSDRVRRGLDVLRSSIAELGQIQQDIVLTDLAEAGDGSDEEIADRWNTSANSIRVLRYKARKRLAKLLGRAIQ